MEFFMYTAISKQLGEKKHLLQGDWNCKKISKISSQAICWKFFQSKPTETFWWPKKPTPFLLLLRFSLFLCPWDRTLVTFWSKMLIQKTQPPFCLKNKEVKLHSLFSASLPGHLLWPQVAKYFSPAHPHPFPDYPPRNPIPSWDHCLFGDLRSDLLSGGCWAPPEGWAPHRKGSPPLKPFYFYFNVLFSKKTVGGGVRQENSRQSKAHWRRVKLNLQLVKDWEDSLVLQGLAGRRHWWFSF